MIHLLQAENPTMVFCQSLVSEKVFQIQISRH